MNALLVLLACSGSGPVAQPPIATHLVVHVDPLPRAGDLGCEDDRLRSCGDLSVGPWRERVDNLGWLSERWAETGRAMDLQWGPEMAFTLAEDPAHLASLRRGYVAAGAADPDAAVAEGVAVGQAAVLRALDAGVAAFGVHVHTVVPDPSGLWGTGPLAGADSGPHPCDAWDGDPLAEAPLETVEPGILYGLSGGAAMSARFGAEIRSLTGSVPRVIANKGLALSDPDALDPAVAREFPAEVQPWLMGGEYSECMIRATGHPPFELYRADDQRSLGGGEGPLVHPGEPVVGNMAVHLDMPADGAAGAAARRMLQAMLAWRAATLVGDAPRPWAYSFHTHDFHLDAGEVARMDPDARELHATDGSPFRADLEAAAAFVDRYAGDGAWQGVAADDGGGPMRWVLPGDEAAIEPRFVLGDPDQAPPADLDEVAAQGGYPYSLLVDEVLADSHLVCTGQLDGVEVHVLQRCSAGWSWGGEAAGFHCSDLARPSWRYVLVPPGPTCLEGLSLEGEVGAVDEDTLGPPARCGLDGIEIPEVGLLVVPGDQNRRLGSVCAALQSTTWEEHGG